MNSLTITIGILAPVITFLIGRYFRAVKAKELDNLSQARDYWRGLLTEHINSDYYSARKLEKDNIDLRKEVQMYKATIKDLIYNNANDSKFQLVANKDKHPAANDNYLYIEGKINGKREAGLLKLSDWSKAKERLLKNPEDNPL